MSHRISICENCNTKIFRPIGTVSWIHVSPRRWACYLQQAIDYRPCAEPKIYGSRTLKGIAAVQDAHA